MDFVQLECFVRAYECGSFSQAAAELYLAQTSFTYRISSLEKELGCPLFVRSKRGVVPTELARAIYEDAVALVNGRIHMLERAKALCGRDARDVRVGFNRYPSVATFFEAIDAYRSLHPDVAIETDFAYLDDPVLALEKGTHDVVFLLDYEERNYAPLNFIPLGELRYHVTMSDVSPLASFDELTLKDLRGQTVFVPKPLVDTVYMVPSVDELRACGVCVDDTMVDNELLLLAIQVGRGVGIYPAASQEIRAGFARRPLVDCAPLRYGLLFAGDRISPATLGLINHVAETIGC